MRRYINLVLALAVTLFWAGATAALSFGIALAARGLRTMPEAPYPTVWAGVMLAAAGLLALAAFVGIAYRVRDNIVDFRRER